MTNIISTFFLLLLMIFNEDDWVYLFNGKNLDGWEIKIRNHKLGDNYKNTFKVNDGSLKVSYENYESFEDKFGHIFYTKKKFKNYHLSLEYKFSGEHLKGAPGWSIKNSGIMLHCQDPKTMKIDQEFPVSAEMQLLGGLRNGERSTANICTPGTDVDIDGHTELDNLNVSGVSTFVGFSTFNDYVFIQDGLNVTGAGITSPNINVSGVVTATQFIGLGQIGVGSEGTSIGTGVTMVDFKSSNGGNTVDLASGIATVTVQTGASIGLVIALGG